MMAAALLLVAALYAGLMGWLRAGFVGLRADDLEQPANSLLQLASRDPSGASPLSGKEEGGLIFSASLSASKPSASKFLELETSPPSPFLETLRIKQMRLGGEAHVQRNAPAFSVLVAARNEAACLPALLAALAAQTYRDFEVLVADDHSTDGTAALLAAAAGTSNFSLRVVTLPPRQTGKKAALAAALALARAPWLVCTDADCRPGPGWLAAYAAHLARQPTANFISGPVLLTGPPTLFQNFMGLEFAGLIGVGAACLARQRPTMCNGANLAYRRAAFAAVGGFADTAHLASGDDEFLLHAIHAQFPGTAFFLAAAAAVVTTPAPASLPALLRQRVRWASKWRHYRAAAPQWLALLVLAANVSLMAGLLISPWQPSAWPWVAAAWLLKLGADFWFMGPVLGFFGRRRWLPLLPLLQLAYAPYALSVGLAGLRGSYQWKDRKVL